MEDNERLRKELEEMERQLRSVSVELERMTKELPNLDERLRFAEQKNLEEQTKKGIDPVNIQPSKEQRQAAENINVAKKAIEKFIKKRSDLTTRIGNLQQSMLEQDLVNLSRAHSALDQRKTQLEGELKEINAELEQLASKKEALAIKIAQQDKG